MNIVLVIVKLFFFLMIRPPPRSTLFPSTPLFRSDRLVPEGVLELARREARRVLVGKEGHGSSCRQEDITDLLVLLAQTGERVVRLKGGDPAVFGRAGEEIEACRAHGIRVRMVPGITAALAAASTLAVSLTHRNHAQRVQFVTGHDRNGELPSDLDLD